MLAIMSPVFSLAGTDKCSALPYPTLACPARHRKCDYLPPAPANAESIYRRTRFFSSGGGDKKEHNQLYMLPAPPASAMGMPPPQQMVAAGYPVPAPTRMTVSLQVFDESSAQHIFGSRLETGPN